MQSNQPESASLKRLMEPDSSSIENDYPPLNNQKHHFK